jgi:hypothetical protein
MKRVSYLGRLGIWARYYAQMWRAKSLMPGLAMLQAGKVATFVPKEAILYLGKPVIFRFDTQSCMYITGEKGFVLEDPIPVSQAKQASEVLSELPQLIAFINEKLRESTNLLDDATMEKELNEPRVVFNSSADGANEVGRWSFEVDQESHDMSYYVIFRRFEFIESYGVG